MSIKQLLNEGILIIDDFKDQFKSGDESFSRIEPNIERHEDLIKDFVSKIKKNKVIKEYWNDDLKYFHDELKNSKNLGDFYIKEIFNDMSDVNRRVIEFTDMTDYILFIGDELGTQISFMSAYDKGKNVFVHHNGIYTGTYVQVSGVGIPNYFEISMNTLPFFNILYEEDKEDEFIKEYLQIISHELTHAMQDIKLNNKRTSLRRISGLYDSQKVKSMEKYVGTPIELPAWGKSIASYYYYNLDKNSKKAIDKLKTLEHFNRGHLEEEVIDYFKKQIPHGNNKAKMIVKYAYLYLKHSLDKEEEMDNIDVKEVI